MAQWGSKRKSRTNDRNRKQGAAPGGKAQVSAPENAAKNGAVKSVEPVAARSSVMVPKAAVGPKAPSSRPTEGVLPTRAKALVGQVVLAMASVPRYRHCSIADIEGLVVAPVLRNRVALVSIGEGVREKTGGAKGSRASLADDVSVALWASVSDVVNAKIVEQIEAGVFPVRLAADEWASGDQIWILDVIAPTPVLVAATVANFSKLTARVARTRRINGSSDKHRLDDVRLHPVVTRQFDAKPLKKMQAEARVV